MVDYGFYKDEFGGSVIPENCFAKYASRAIFYLDSITFGQAGEKLDCNVKMAACDIAEIYFEHADFADRKSESVDGYSVTWQDGEPLENRLMSAARLYLGNSGLLYRGERF